MSHPVSIIESPVSRLDVAQAQQAIWNDCSPITGHQQITVREALHRILAEPVYSPINVPAHTNSAVDGYAVQHADLNDRYAPLDLVGTALAGNPFDGQVVSAPSVNDEITARGQITRQGGFDRQTVQFDWRRYDEIVPQTVLALRGQWRASA